MMLNFQLNNSFPSTISYQTNVIVKLGGSHKDCISFQEPLDIPKHVCVFGGGDLLFTFQKCYSNHLVSSQALI